MIISPRPNSEPPNQGLALPDDPELAQRLRNEHPGLYPRARSSYSKIFAIAGITSIFAGYATGSSIFAPHRSHAVATHVHVSHAAPIGVHHSLPQQHVVAPQRKVQPAPVAPRRYRPVEAPLPILQPQRVAQSHARAVAVSQANAQAQAQAQAKFWLQAQAQARAQDRARAKAAAVAAAPVPRNDSTDSTVAAPPNTGSTAPDPTGNTAPRIPTGSCRHGRGILIGGHGLAAGIFNFVLQNVHIKGLLPGRP